MKIFSLKFLFKCFLIALLLSVQSCKREIDIVSIVPPEITVEQAKEYYLQKFNIPVQNANIVSNSASSNKATSKNSIMKRLEKYIRWNVTKKTQTNNESILLVDIDDSRILFKKDVFVTRKLVFYKTNTKSLEMNVVEIIGFKKLERQEEIEYIQDAILNFKNGRNQKQNNLVNILIYDANYVRSEKLINGEQSKFIFRASTNKTINGFIQKDTLQNNLNSIKALSEGCTLWYVIFTIRDNYGNVVSETLLYSYYEGNCNGGEGSPITEEQYDPGIGGDLNLDESYQSIVDEYADNSSSNNNTFNTNITSPNGSDAIQDIQSWNVARHWSGSWSLIADTRYGYYHTEYFSVSEMRNNQVYNVFLYNTDKVVFNGSNTFITSVWNQSSISDQVLNNNSENAKGRTVVTGTVDHTMKVEITVGYVKIDKLYSSVTHVHSNPFTLIFR
ncbi:MAG: hypothetical protein Q8K64_00225 [Sediminibacterium sp.]|nr:hypothetical protein [Sediminibacterium sp.]